MQVPTPVFVVLLLAPPVTALLGYGLGCLTGAWVSYASRTGRNPVRELLPPPRPAKPAAEAPDPPPGPFDRLKPLKP